MRGVCVPAHRVDSHNEILFELHAPRYERQRHLVAAVDAGLSQYFESFRVGSARQKRPSWIGFSRSGLGLDRSAHTEVIG